jgi:hypothetical protein
MHSAFNPFAAFTQDAADSAPRAASAAVRPSTRRCARIARSCRAPPRSAVARESGALYHRAPVAGRRVMVLGLSLSTFTLLHLILSLAGIVAGIVIILGMLGSNQLPGWTALFLASMVLTDVTGFFFPVAALLPSHIVGVISLMALMMAIIALYIYRLRGAWRWLYVGAVGLALYLDVFVGVVQAFQKLSFLRPLAPTQSEPPFLIAQLVVLALFIALGIVAAKRFHPEMRALA